MTTLEVRDELIFDLVSQSSSGVYLRDGMLWRSLRFEASVDSRSALHDPLLKEGGRPVASVSLQQADDKDLIGWVHVDSERTVRQGWDYTLQHYDVTANVPRDLVELAETLSHHHRYLQLRLKLLENSEIAGTIHWHSSWDPARTNPRAVRFVSLVATAGPR